ncbi:hypothetical protein JL782_07865 [Staphylococcus pseudintermedius]|nr:hypothetical protein [Staphylococcus pseudintermedius]
MTKEEKKILKNICFRVNKKILSKKEKCYVSSCESKAIKSHSFHKKGILNSLANSEGIVYHTNLPKLNPFSDTQLDRYIMKTHVNEAGTFYGFCNHHDTSLFLPIENKDRMCEDIKEYIFLHAYRGFAYTHQYELRVREYNEECLKQVKNNPKISQQTKENFKFIVEKPILSDDMVYYENFKNKAEEIFEETSDTINLLKLEKNFKIDYIELYEDVKFASTSASTTLSNSSKDVVCIGVIPENHLFKAMFFVMRLAENKGVDLMVNELKEYKINQEKEKLKNYIQNLTIFSSSNIVISSLKMEELNNLDQLGSLLNLHNDSIDIFNKKTVNCRRDYGFSLF